MASVSIPSGATLATASLTGKGVSWQWKTNIYYTTGYGTFRIWRVYGIRSNADSRSDTNVTITITGANNGVQYYKQTQLITVAYHTTETANYWQWERDKTTYPTGANFDFGEVGGITDSRIKITMYIATGPSSSYWPGGSSGAATFTWYIDMPACTNTINHWAGGFKNSEGNNGNKTMYHLGSTTFTAYYGNSVTYNSSRAITIPKGFSLSSNMGSSSWAGSWTTYTMPTTLTQPAKATSMQYDYWPNSYSISYVMNGGTNNNSNPSSYNVLYQAQLYNPSRTGYRFNAWEQRFSKGNISFSAATGNYHYQVLHYNVRPGESFTVSIDSVSLTAGSATSFSVLIHDFTSGSTVSHNWGGISSSKQWITVNCPTSSDSTHDYRLLIYAGPAGSTANVAISYTNLQVHCKSSYVNYGKNATFSSSDDLYTQLNLRNIGNITATALWNANVYTIQYNANGGSGAPSNSSKTYDTQLLIPSTEPTRDGYEFLGWSSSSTATSASYTAGSYLTTDLSTTHGAIVVLYAVWRELKVYVNVDGVWVEGSPYINIDGEWKRIVCVYVNDGSTWRPMG